MFPPSRTATASESPCPPRVILQSGGAVSKGRWRAGNSSPGGPPYRRKLARSEGERVVALAAVEWLTSEPLARLTTSTISGRPSPTIRRLCKGCGPCSMMATIYFLVNGSSARRRPAQSDQRRAVFDCITPRRPAPPPRRLHGGLAASRCRRLSFNPAIRQRLLEFLQAFVGDRAVCNSQFLELS